MGESAHSARVRVGTALTTSKGAIVAELLIAFAILAAGFLGLIPGFGGTPVLFFFAWLSLRVRGKGWAEYGLIRPTLWMLLFAIAFGIGYQFLSIRFIDPAFARWSGRLPDVSLLRPLVGNVKMLAFWLLITWTVAAFGEEFVYRGYLMNRIADMGNRKKLAWVISLLLSSFIFGLGHAYQGMSGILSVAFGAILTGVIYLGAKRNLWVVVLVHGVSDTVGFLLIFLGKYPGL